ncbi:hypothetical protein M0P65_00535 [Candidatus Gracilibacteria bacterium]|nr:hypothetical protein [Candidatus Gracilibacteria bacterium]
MKTKILFLFIVLFGIINSTSANYDGVTYVSYFGSVHNPYYMEVKTKNLDCPSRPEKVYKENVFPVLNVGSSSMSCNKPDPNSMECSYVIESSGAPTGFVMGGFYIYGGIKQILDSLGIPAKIVNKSSGNYVKNFNLQLLLGTSSVGTKLGISTGFDFADYGNPFYLFENNNPIEYRDNTECGGTGSLTVNLPPITPANPAIDIENGDRPATIGEAKIDGCTYSLGTYTCFASSNLDFKIKLSALGLSNGSPVGIDKLNLSLNNCSNTAQVTDPVNAPFVLNNISTYGSYSYSNPKFKQTGCYTLDIYGKYGNSPIFYTNFKSLKINIVPNNDFKLGTATLTGGAYANNLDTAKLCVSITDSYGNVINKNYGIQDVVINGEGFDIDTINPGFDGEGLRLSNNTFNNSKSCFDVKSLVPGQKNVSFKITIPEHNESTSLNASGNFKKFDFTKLVSFKKPFIGTLSIDGDTFKIGTEQTLKMDVISKKDLSTHNISNFINSLNAINSSYIVKNKNGEKYLTDNPIVNFTLNYGGNTTIGTSGVKVNPYISYNLGGKDIKYILGATDGAIDNSPIILDKAEFLGVKIIGNLQGTGKQTITGQASNFSDLSKSDQRSKIKQNAYKLIKGMNSNTVVNGVKYFEGNINLTGDNLGFETLVVKNGNVKITGDLNDSGKKLGIIVIRDDQSKTNLGNVYVKPNVNNINAIIYADGGFISTDIDGIPYSVDSTVRTRTLSNQLTLKGSLFTRNTIGGAILTGGKYILPGGSTLSDTDDNFNKAMIYDLNYIRRGYTGWDKNNNNKLDSGEYKNPFVIIYNNILQTNPPKGF